MCYWRRLSKRSVDNNDFEYTDDRLAGNSSSPEPFVSDRLSLFKALQVRHEPVEPERARRRAQQLEEIYAEDEEAQLVCYRQAEVFVFMATLGSLLVLVVAVAVTCCLRIRRLTRSQFEHRPLGKAPPSSLSPSLLSISDSLSSSPTAPSTSAQKLPTPVAGATNHLLGGWQLQQQLHSYQRRRSQQHSRSSLDSTTNAKFFAHR